MYFLACCQLEWPNSENWGGCVNSWRDYIISIRSVPTPSGTMFWAYPQNATIPWFHIQHRIILHEWIFWHTVRAPHWAFGHACKPTYYYYPPPEHWYSLVVNRNIRVGCTDDVTEDTGQANWRTWENIGCCSAGNIWFAMFKMDRW